jgi:hypothetical protein
VGGVRVRGLEGDGWDLGLDCGILPRRKGTAFSGSRCGRCPVYEASGSRRRQRLERRRGGRVLLGRLVAFPKEQVRAASAMRGSERDGVRKRGVRGCVSPWLPAASSARGAGGVKDAWRGELRPDMASDGVFLVQVQAASGMRGPEGNNVGERGVRGSVLSWRRRGETRAASGIDAGGVGNMRGRRWE